MEYRAYTVGEDGFLNPPKVFESDSDEEALIVVKGFLNGKPIELWEGARMVSWCENIDGQFMVLETRELKRA
jgi:hypothetical protein